MKHIPQFRFGSFLVLALTPCLPVALGQSGAIISGTVIGDDGGRVKATVSAIRSATPAVGGRAQAADDGTFTLSGVAPGTYNLCASIEDQSYLDPCVWSAQDVTVQVSASDSVAGLKVVMKKATMLQVRLQDPDKLLAKSADPKKAEPQVILGVFTPRRTFRLLQPVATDDKGRAYQIVVPVDETASSLYVMAAGATLIDHLGKEVDPNGKNLPMVPSSGKRPKMISLTIKGPKKP